MKRFAAGLLAACGILLLAGLVMGAFPGPGAPDLVCTDFWVYVLLGGLISGLLGSLLALWAERREVTT